MKIMYIPLDERPCNYYYPLMLAEFFQELELVTPPKEMLGNKKLAADTERLWEWIDSGLQEQDAAVMSVEMLVYGGLLPSRLHRFSMEDCMARVEKIRSMLLACRGRTRFYLYSLIMRTPRYSSSEEEPDYYGYFGEKIFEYGVLCDKKSRGLADNEGIKKPEEKIPGEVIQDFLGRRDINIKVTAEIVNMVKEGLVGFMSIPQDDSSPYGFTVMDQRKIFRLVEQYGLQNVIHIYPGADETGGTLLIRAVAEFYNKRPLIWAYYSPAAGEQVIPKYEDRPLGESVTAHIRAAGALPAGSMHEADLVLMVNGCSGQMREAWEQEEEDAQYEDESGPQELVKRLKEYISLGKRCTVADAAFSNGADLRLVSMLSAEKLSSGLYGYAAWNTACNTVGTSISVGIAGFLSNNNRARIKNICYRFLEDWAYQSVVRQKAQREVLPELGASYYNPAGKEKEICLAVKNGIWELWERYMKQGFQGWKLTAVNLYLPWRRMFEIGMDIEIDRVDDYE